MRILYLTHTRLPTERAHGKQMIKTSEALARRGFNVTVAFPERKGSFSIDDITRFYGIDSDAVAFRRIKCPDIFRFGKVAFVIGLAILFLKALYQLGGGYNVLYTRVDWIALMGSLVFPKVIWEVHEAKTGYIARILARRRGVYLASITAGILSFQHKYGIRFPSESVIPDAVDLQNDDPATVAKPLVEALRASLGLGQDERVLLYAGSIGLYPWKGVDLVIEAARVAPPPWRTIVLGGNAEEIAVWQKKYPNNRCIWHPRVDPGEISLWYALANAFILPNKKGDLVSELFTSPMKLFEYMWAGKPILASRLPSIQEVVSDEDVWFMDPDKPTSDMQAFFQEAYSVAWIALGSCARTKARQYTWDNRAEKIEQLLLVDNGTE